MRGEVLAKLPRPERAALRELLVAATAGAGRPAADPRLPALVAAAPINYVAAAARLHRVDGCVHESLHAVPGVPSDVVAELAAARQHAALRHLVTSRVLADIASAFDAAGVRWLVMKGPALTSALYRDPGLRAYNDLDVLVARASFPAAVRALEAEGFNHKIQNWALHRWFRAAEIGLVGHSVTVDLHWAVEYARYDRRHTRVGVEAMLERRRVIEIGGRAAPTFEPVDTLLHLALHAARSNGDHLLWFKDIERSLAVDEPDLDELTRRARAFRCAASVGVALRRARVVLGAAVPAEVTAALLGRPLEAVERAAIRWSNPVRLDDGDSLAAFVARSMRADIRSSAISLGERAYRAGKEKAFGHEGLRRHPAGDPAGESVAEMQAYLHEVAHGWPGEQ